MGAYTIKLVIFDWSGVIADTFENYYFCAMEVFKAYGAPVITKAEAREEFRQPYMAFYNKFLPDISKEDANRVYIKAMQTCPRPAIFSGMKKVLASLSDNDVHMAIISGDAKESLLVEMEHFQISHFFKDVLYDVYDKTDAVANMIREHAIHPQEALFVGDSMHEVEVGKNVGCKTCAVTWGFVSKEKLQKLHPDFIVDTPKQLEQIII